MSHSSTGELGDVRAAAPDRSGAQEARSTAPPPACACAARIANTAHDLKDPLLAIQLALSFVLDDAAAGDGPLSALPPQVARRQLVAAREAAERAWRLVDEALAPERERTAPADAVACTDVAATVRSLVAQYRLQAMPRDVVLACEVDDGLPGVPVRPGSLQRAVGNLLGNALKFTPDRGRITVRVARTRGGLRISVADTGPGLTAEALGRVFEARWQAAETAHLGHGLGLSIVRAIAEGAGGAVGCMSLVGEGATFWLALPAVASPTPDGPATHGLDARPADMSDRDPSA